ncbi:hypothetical protein RYO59_002408 [Thermosynechococcaceae cyanobacterium Okahandja]
MFLRSFSGVAAVLVASAGLCLSQPARAQSASPFSEETLMSTVEQMSDSLASYIKGSSCADVAKIVKMIPTDGNSPPPDPSSILGSVILTVKNSPNLQSTIATRVGPPLINKMLECNMISVDLLMQATTAPRSPR